MEILFWTLVLIACILRYTTLLDNFSKNVEDSEVEPIIVKPLNKNTIRYPSNNSTFRNVTDLQKVIVEREQKIDLQKQYLAWKENARQVDEYFNRGQNLQMKSG
jgi:hypothetical protein